LASRETLANYLAKYCPDVELLDMADSVKTGIAIIKKHQPDIVFLDIEMPFGNAFDLLEQFDDISFEIIFVTAYSNYAIQALNMSASYYILKPIAIEELIKAVEKVKQNRENDVVSIHSRVLMENIQALNARQHKIVLPMMEGFEVVEVKDIIRCKANDNFTDFFLVDGSKRMICRTLKYYENLLEEFNFLRIHKSHLINMQHIKKYIKGKAGQVVMSDDSVVDLSVNRKQAFLAKFG